MAEEALNLLLKKMGTMLSEEANLLGGLREEVEDIECELKGMQNYLMTGEASVVFVDEVRELAHDTEDCIDSFRLHIAAESRPKEEDGCVCFLEEAYHFLKTLLRRHQIAKEIKKIKAKAKRQHVIRSRYPQPGSLTQQASSQRRNDARSAAPCSDEDQLILMKERRGELKDLLLKGQRQLTVISVVGMGGLGKTTEAWNLSMDEEVQKTFQYRAWIGVSQLSNSQELLRYLMNQIFQQGQQVLPQGLEFMTELQLADQLKKFLRNKKYMIILDDVREQSVWERIAGAFPDSENGSRVMVTSQIHNITSHDIGSCDYLTHVHKLPDLRDAEAWDLFRRRAFRANAGFHCPPHLVNVARSIVELCAGLPLAIVTVGGLLKNKPQTENEWSRFKDSLVSEFHSKNKLPSVQRILSLGYDDLPVHLKPCILCFGAFQVIKQTRLMRIWTAEGFVTHEEVAMDYLKELTDRSMVQVSELDPLGGTTKICHVHGFMHEILKFRCMEQSFYTFLQEQHGGTPPTNGNNNQHALGSPVPPSRKIRRLSVRGSSPQVYGSMASLLKRTKCSSSLRSLIIAVPTPIPVPSHDLSYKFVMLRVLDLEGTNVSWLPGQIASCRLLKYLSLRNTNLDSVPKSLSRLLNLETLDLRGTQITTLPAGVIKLHRLRHLLVPCPTSSKAVMHVAWYESAAQPGVRVPRGVGRLRGLVKLAMFDIDHSDVVLAELRNLTQLRKLGVRCVRREDGEQLCNAIENMPVLRSLVLHSKDTDEPLDLHSWTSPPKFLEHLFLAGPLDKLPTWAQSLRSIARIVLMGSRLMVDLFDAFQGLTTLTHLSLIEAFAGTHLCSSKGGFKQLKILHLSNLNWLESVTVAQGAMPDLGTLSIWYCGALQQVPSGIEHLTSLKELQLLGMQEEFVHKLRRDVGTESDWWKVARIPIIRSRTFITSQAGDWSGWIDEDPSADIASETEEEEEEEENDDGHICIRLEQGQGH